MPTDECIQGRREWRRKEVKARGGQMGQAKGGSVKKKKFGKEAKSPW